MSAPTATTPTVPAARSKLQNGAYVLDAKPTHGQVPCAIVLAFWPQSPDPFVTWIVRLDDLAATSGYYYSDLEDAIADFKDRG